VKRMARLADNARFGMRQQRMAALQWLAAVSTKLGGVLKIGWILFIGLRGWLDFVQRMCVHVCLRGIVKRGFVDRAHNKKAC